jgi:hypothetical protein
MLAYSLHYVIYRINCVITSHRSPLVVIYLVLLLLVENKTCQNNILKNDIL